MTSPTSAPDAAATPLAPPPSQAPNVHGRFLWYDLMTPDTDAAVAFYTTVAGWGTGKWEMGEGMPPYTMWMNGDAMLGGTMKISPDEVAKGTPAHWLAYVGADDCDATHQKAVDLGARSYVPPTDIPTVGRYAVLGDPQGATFALYTPSNEPPPAKPMPEVGEMAWHELAASDLDPAFAFYSQLFGWEKTMDMDMGEMGIYRMFGHGTSSSGGMYKAPPEMPPSWTLYIAVADLEAAADRVRANGGTITHEPTDVPGGRIVMARDPQGGNFALFAPSHEQAPAA